MIKVKQSAYMLATQQSSKFKTGHSCKFLRLLLTVELVVKCKEVQVALDSYVCDIYNDLCGFDRVEID